MSDRIVVKGKSKPVAIHEILEYHTPESFPSINEALGHFKHGLESYRGQRWDAAIKAFENAVALNPRDKAAKLYVARCQTLKETPPGDDWDGVFVMETK